MATNELAKVMQSQGGGAHAPWDAKRITGLLFAGGILLLIGWGFTIYILPWLLTLAWGIVELAVACIIGAFLLAILFNPKFWRGIRYLSEAISQFLLGWAIEMNPWKILNLQIEEAEKDREQLRKHGELLKGQEDSLTTQINENDQAMQIAAKKVSICQKKLQANPDDFDTQNDYETANNDFINAKDFIDGVKPVSNDISKLVVFADKAYRKSGPALSNAKNTLKIQKAKYDAVTTASATMAKAMRAFSGNPQLNSDADIAVKFLRQDISNKIGSIKTSIQITSQVMNQRDLNDAAKVSLAAEAALKFDDSAFEYSKTLDASRMQVGGETSVGNKYLELITKKQQ